MSYLLAMFGSIALSGVNPAAYREFVDYTVQATQPKSNTISALYTTGLSKTISYIALVLILVIVICVLIVLFIFTSLDYLTSSGAAIVFIVILSVLSIFYAVAYTYSFISIADTSEEVEIYGVQTAVYTANSVFRDGIYSFLGK